MAAGGERGCKLASDQELHHDLRKLWKSWLEGQDLSEPGLLEVAPGQPRWRPGSRLPPASRGGATSKDLGPATSHPPRLWSS